MGVVAVESGTTEIPGISAVPSARQVGVSSNVTTRVGFFGELRFKSCFLIGLLTFCWPLCDDGELPEKRKSYWRTAFNIDHSIESTISEYYAIRSQIIFTF